MSTERSHFGLLGNHQHPHEPTSKTKRGNALPEPQLSLLGNLLLLYPLR